MVGHTKHRCIALRVVASWRLGCLDPGLRPFSTFIVTTLSGVAATLWQTRLVPLSGRRPRVTPDFYGSWQPSTAVGGWITILPVIRSRSWAGVDQKTADEWICSKLPLKTPIRDAVTVNDHAAPRRKEKSSACFYTCGASVY
ncbi:MAG: hypothetical protein RL701_5962 [Pseudomonadota bacterium]